MVLQSELVKVMSTFSLNSVIINLIYGGSIKKSILLYGLFHFILGYVYYLAGAMSPSFQSVNLGTFHSPQSGREILGSLAHEVANRATADNTISLVSFVFIELLFRSLNIRYSYITKRVMLISMLKSTLGININTTTTSIQATYYKLFRLTDIK